MTDDSTDQDSTDRDPADRDPADRGPADRGPAVHDSRDRQPLEGVRILGADETRPRSRPGRGAPAPIRPDDPPTVGREIRSQDVRIGGAPAADTPDADRPQGAMWGDDADWEDEDWVSAASKGAPSAAREVDAGDGDDTSSWTAFAGSAPRWRDQPRDWDDADVNAALGAANTESGDPKMGALNPDREAKAAAFTFDDQDMAEVKSPRPKRVAKPRAGEPPAPPSGSRPGGAPGRPGGPRRTAPQPGPTGAGRDLPTAIATGVVLLAAAALLLVVGKSRGGVVLVLVALLAAGFELFTALRQRAFQPAIPVGLAAIAGLVGATYWKGTDGLALVLGVTVLVAMLWYLFGVTRDRPAVNIAVTWFVVLYVGLLGAFAAALLREPNGRWVFFAPILATVASDIFGYAVGRTFGRTKLAPEISPNKTWEGTIGGFLATVVFCGLLFGIRGVGPWNGREGWLLGVVVGVAAPLGDLCESLIKRDLGVKDVSNFLPGHGGVLDRIDGMLFAIPATYFLIRIIGIQ